MARPNSSRRRGIGVTLVGALVAAWFATVAASAAAGGAAVAFGPVAAAYGANSANWAGWAAAGYHTAVSASWRQPSVSCAAHETSDSAFWVGLDGYGSASVQQVGTQAGCSDGHPFHSAWTEFYPAPAAIMANPVRPGDAMRATVAFVSGRTYRLTLSDSTSHWSRTVTATAGKAKNASVEIVAEAPTDARTLKAMRLTHFSGVRFTGVSVDGSRLTAVSRLQQLVMGSSTRVMVDTSNVDSAQSFGVNWRAASG